MHFLCKRLCISSSWRAFLHREWSGNNFLFVRSSKLHMFQLNKFVKVVLPKPLLSREWEQERIRQGTQCISIGIVHTAQTTFTARYVCLLLLFFHFSSLLCAHYINFHHFPFSFVVLSRLEPKKKMLSWCLRQHFVTMTTSYSSHRSWLRRRKAFEEWCGDIPIHSKSRMEKSW